MAISLDGMRKGRGASSNPHNRFFSTHSEAEDDGWSNACGQEPDALKPLLTTVTVQQSRTIISRNQSPDVPFTQSINPYQGCEHGCIYCYARPSHAYFDLSPGLDFETRLFAKPNAAVLLRKELSHPRYQPSAITIGANTDPYQPIEREWKITRSLLEVMLETRHPVSIITKNALILRDLDLLSELAKLNLLQVFISVTSLDASLSQKLEPRASAPHRRLFSIGKLSDAGIPTGCLLAPLIPFINDAEMEAILKAVADAGANTANYVFIRLAHELKEMFRTWLQEHKPLKAERVMAVINDARGGRDNDPRFGTRMRGEGQFAELLRQRFLVSLKKNKLDLPLTALRCDLFTAPELPVKNQLTPQLFLF